MSHASKGGGRAGASGVGGRGGGGAGGVGGRGGGGAGGVGGRGGGGAGGGGGRGGAGPSGRGSQCRALPSDPGFIYIIQMSGSYEAYSAPPFAKVGFTNSCQHRLGNLKAGNPYRLTCYNLPCLQQGCSRKRGPPLNKKL